MSDKLSQKTFPTGHGPDDFKCFGPAATRDAQFDGTMICDMGCFKQDGTDSNKYYHASVCQSTKKSQWFAYFEWGRTGAVNPSFQFVKCESKSEAEAVYAKQLHSKNDKRGEWHSHPTLGEILKAKANKDCYLVRPQATRDTGLTDAKTITSNEGADESKKITKKKKKKSSVPKADRQTMALMHDLNVGTLKYTRSSVAGNALPTQIAIDEGRDILQAALAQVKTVGDDTDDQVNDSELKSLTTMMYGRVPKIKDRNADSATWILSQDNITEWQQDLDAFESALYAVDLGDSVDSDPFGGMDITMRHLTKSSDLGEFIYNWMPGATRGRHSWCGAMKIKNVWEVERKGDVQKLHGYQDRFILKDKWTSREKPMHQPKNRPDLDADTRKRFRRSGTFMCFHGTRTVNVSGILRESLRLPRQLVGVVITGAMFGPGLYWADDWKKSAGYTSLQGSYWSAGSGGVSGRSAFMFVADVALGKPYVAPSSGGYTKPPKGYHCVLGKAGLSVQNNEFVTYDSSSNRLRYLVEFDQGRR